tara:strand:- start:170 stop:505 length:336 start_codon:yes stop_codon:yes gene_type:complete
MPPKWKQILKRLVFDENAPTGGLADDLDEATLTRERVENNYGGSARLGHVNPHEVEVGKRHQNPIGGRQPFPIIGVHDKLGTFALDGNHRILEARKQGMKQVPAWIVDLNE